MKKYIAGSFLICTLFTFTNIWAGGSQDFNDCRTSTGSTIDNSGKFDTLGWPGLCDMVHVSLVQGTCFIDWDEIIVANLSDTTYARITALSGTLTCGGDDGGSTGGGSNFCDTHPDHRRCQ